MTKGMVIIPTELIPQNADKLLSILLELALQNGLETAFLDWLEHANEFCNSLVDRIVPGKLNAEEKHEIEIKYGYQDELMIMSEVYRFWAIESANEKVKQLLSFSVADIGVAIVPDITTFRELKLRLLNGSHTFSCGLAHLAGFDTVKEAMDDKPFSSFITNLMIKEIAPSITTKDLTIEDAKTFAGKVLDRYRNPYIEHHWLSITMQYSSKMRMRNESTIKKYISHFNTVPPYMALGFAGYLLFMKSVEEAGNKYYGEANGKRYLINDDSAAYYHELWLKNNEETLVEKVLANEKLWGDDLSTIPDFVDAVKNNLKLLMSLGARKAMENM
jgi:tagaturonate reductase